MNRRHLLSLATAAGALGLAGPAFAQRRGNPAPAAVGAVDTHTAIVETVDQTARQVLLRGEDGSLHTIPVGPEVRNLAQLRSGDTVTIEFREGLAVALANPADGAPAASVAGAARRRPTGARPGGGVARVVTLRVTVTAVDTAANTVTFTGPLGKSRTVAVQRPELQAFIRQLRPGQQVDIAYAESVVFRAHAAR
jgi:hypothetical protein